MPPAARGGKLAAAFVAVWLPLCCLAAAPARAGDEVPPALAGVEAAFRAWAERRSVGEASLAVGRDGRLAAALGLGGRGAGDAALIASLSKAITAVCVGTLVDEGRLGFDTTVDAALAGFFARRGAPADPRLGAATIGQLLAHRAGFDRSDAPDPASGGSLPRHLREHRGGDAAIDDLLALALARPLPRAPGEAFAYTNAPYLMLGKIVEEADGRRYEEACAARALAPLGVRGARLDPGWAVISSFGGWRLSAPEYLAFLRAFDDSSPVLGPRARAYLRDAEGKQVGGRGIYYALGSFARATPDGGRSLWHAGRWRWREGVAPDSVQAVDVGAYFVRLAGGEAFVALFGPPSPGPEALRDLDRALVVALRGVRAWPAEDLFARYGVAAAVVTR